MTESTGPKTERRIWRAGWGAWDGAGAPTSSHPPGSAAWLPGPGRKQEQTVSPSWTGMGIPTPRPASLILGAAREWRAQSLWSGSPNSVQKSQHPSSIFYPPVLPPSFSSTDHPVLPQGSYWQIKMRCSLFWLPSRAHWTRASLTGRGAAQLHGPHIWLNALLSPSQNS